MLTSEHRPTARVLDILQLLSTSKDGFSLTEIAATIKVPKSTIVPIIRTLCDRQFITLSGNGGKYIIGINSFIVGSSCLHNIDVLSLIKSQMKKVVEATSEVCQLGILIDGDVLYLAKEDSSEPIRLISFVGKRLPAYSTALGKSLISEFTLEELHQIYKNGLQPVTKNTCTDFDQLIKECLIAKKRGYFSEKRRSIFWYMLFCSSIDVCWENYCSIKHQYSVVSIN
ncbi:IclR family transcriptional regulator [Megasphaera paucivorans]|uniref:IclR family transcriptional regulator n=1 Tax=Megasphaera paucivorans TaxID=349095 RepID=UPI003CE98044